VRAAVQPETRYAWLGRDRIAYQVMGQRPPDLVTTPGSFTHVDLVWEDPAAAPVPPQARLVLPVDPVRPSGYRLWVRKLIRGL
jgi:hypothetical protein